MSEEIRDLDKWMDFTESQLNQISSKLAEIETVTNEGKEVAVFDLLSDISDIEKESQTINRKIADKQITLKSIKDSINFHMAAMEATFNLLKTFK